jgi:putative membrane protein
MAQKLSADDHDRIAKAIAAAEGKTSGEIYGVVARQASDYRLTPLLWASIASLLVPALIAALGLDLHRWPPFGEPWFSGEASAAQVDASVEAAMITLVMIQALVFALVAAIASPMPVRMLLTPRSFKRDRVKKAAFEQFIAHGLQRTDARTGVLIYIALAEREARVVADDGIAAKVAQSVWDETIDALTGPAHEGRIADGMIAAIERCGAVLATHFPRKAGDRNEIDDRVVEV